MNEAAQFDTHEWTFPGGSGIVTTTTGGTREAPDFCISGGSEDGRRELAAEVLKLAGEPGRIRKDLIEAMTAWRKDMMWPASPTERSLGADAALNAFLLAVDRILPERKERQRK